MSSGVNGLGLNNTLLKMALALNMSVAINFMAMIFEASDYSFRATYLVALTVILFNVVTIVIELISRARK